MPAWLLPAILGGASFLKGAMGGNRNQSNSRSSSTSSGTSTSTPTMAAEYSPMMQALISMNTQRLMKPSSLPDSYEQAGIRNINNTYDLAEGGLKNRLAAQGMSRSGMAGSGLGRLSGGRASDIVQFQGTIPMLNRQLQDQDMQNAMQLAQFGRGQTTTGTQTGSQNYTGSSGQPGGLTGGTGSLIDALGWMYGAGMLGGGGGSAPTMNNGGMIRPQVMPRIPGIGPGTFPGWAS